MVVVVVLVVVVVVDEVVVVDVEELTADVSIGNSVVGTESGPLAVEVEPRPKQDVRPSDVVRANAPSATGPMTRSAERGLRGARRGAGEHRIASHGNAAGAPGDVRWSGWRRPDIGRRDRNNGDD